MESTSCGAAPQNGMGIGKPKRETNDATSLDKHGRERRREPNGRAAATSAANMERASEVRHVFARGGRRCDGRAVACHRRGPVGGGGHFPLSDLCEMGGF